VRATGDILFPCDQDDIWDPGKIEVLARALEESPGSGAAICNSSLIDARGRVLPSSLFERVGLDMSIRRRMELGTAMVRIAGRTVVASHALALRGVPSTSCCRSDYSVTRTGGSPSSLARRPV
jgi:hypothetical protein